MVLREVKEKEQKITSAKKKHKEEPS